MGFRYPGEFIVLVAYWMSFHRLRLVKTPHKAAPKGRNHVSTREAPPHEIR